jgi:hypothetical protein
VHLHPLEPVFVFIFCTVEMLFSIRPGSTLGFAITMGDWGSLFRKLDKKDLQSKRLLREAARRSFVIQSLFFALGLSAAWSAGNLTAGGFFVLIAAAISGLACAYLMLLWTTRPGGWYGLD